MQQRGDRVKIEVYATPEEAEALRALSRQEDISLSHLLLLSSEIVGGRPELMAEVRARRPESRRHKHRSRAA